MSPFLKQYIIVTDSDVDSGIGHSRFVLASLLIDLPCSLSYR